MLRSIALALALLFVAASALQLTSQDFSNGGTIPQALSCDGTPYGVSPHLSWSDVPKDTQSLALVMYDQTAYGLFYHWFVILPTSTNQLARGDSMALPQGSQPVLNYIPVCPPHGKAHFYKIQLFALAEADLELSEDMSEALDQLRTRSLASSMLTASYGGKQILPTSTSGERKPEYTSKSHADRQARYTNQLQAHNLLPNSTVNLLSNEIFPFLQAELVRAFVFPTMIVTNPDGSFSKKLRVTFRLTLLNGPDVCFNAGFSDAPIQTSLNKVCATVAQRTIFLSLENVNPLPNGNISFWLVAYKNETGSSQWQGSVTTTIAEDDHIEDILTIQYGIFTPLSLPNSSFRRAHLFPYLLIPAVPTGFLLKVTVTVNITVMGGSDDFPICFAGSFVPIKNLLSKANPKFVCKSRNSGTFVLKWNKVFKFDELPPPQPYLLVASSDTSVGKRNVQGVDYGLLASEPTYTVLNPPAPELSTFSFVFANMFKGAAKRSTPLFK